MWRGVIPSFVLLLVVFPTYVHADKPVFKTKEDAAKACIKKLLQTPATSTNKQATTESSDKCISDSITIDTKGNKSIKPTEFILPDVPLTTDLAWCVPNACKPEDKPGKCGTITYTIPALSGSGNTQQKTFSKCDSSKQNLVDSAGTNPGGTAAQAVAAAAIDNMKSADGTIDSSKLSQALQNLGVGQDAANTIANDSTKQQQAYEMLQQLASGDQSQIAQAKSTANDLGITLNEDTLNKISSLQPDGFKTLVGNGVANDQQQQTLNSISANPSTFQQQGGDNNQSGTLTDGNACGYSGIAGSMMYSETRCGKLTAPTGQAAQGPLQYQCGTWQNYANATGHSDWSDCSNRYDPNKAAQVTNEYYQNVWAPQYEAQCTGSGYSEKACAYSYHWLGVGDYNKITQGIANGTIDPNASFTSLCGTVVSTGVCTQNPGLVYANSQSRSQPYTVGGVFQHLDTLMGGASSAPTTYAGPAYSGLGTSPFSFNAQGNQDYNYSGYSSPYVYTSAAPAYSTASVGNTQQISTSGYTSPYYTYTNSGTAANTTVQPTTVSQSSTNTSLQTTLQNLAQSSNTSKTVTAQPALVQPSAQVIVYPQRVGLGHSTEIIWSSTGTSLTSPCTLSILGQVRSTADEGSVSYTATTAGSIPVTLHCIVASSGVSYDRSATITVTQ